MVQDPAVKKSEIPQLSRGQRLTDDARHNLGQQLLERYQAGASIRDLRDETGYSLGRIRRLLLEAGVEFRGRGGGHPRKKA